MLKPLHHPERGRIPVPALVPLALFATLGIPTGRPAAPVDRTLTIVATEFAFAAPDTVPAGRTRVRLTSHGREMHIVEIARLDSGHTAEELAALLDARKPFPPWAHLVGGPLPKPGGGTMEVTVELAPGRYALICPIPSPDDHKSHMSKGMVRTLVVVPERGGSSRAAPGARRESRLILDDYGYVLEPMWTAGRHTFRVENRAAQPHEVVVFRLAEGKTLADMLAWAKALAGPPPGEFVGGTTALSRGSTLWFDATLAPGNYALLCFAPAPDGRSHIAHGMTRELTVRDE